jgi:hypothetical protein
MLDSAKRRAKLKGLEFSLTPADITIPNKCPLLGIEITKGIGKIHPGSPSLDRIDNEKGYTADNVWVISNQANAMKHSATLSEWRLFCKKSLKFLKTYDP